MPIDWSDITGGTDVAGMTKTPGPGLEDLVAPARGVGEWLYNTMTTRPPALDEMYSIRPSNETALNLAANLMGPRAGGPRITGAGWRTGQMKAGAGERLEELAANRQPKTLEEMPKELQDQLTTPTPFLERLWRNYGRHMTPDEVMTSEPIWSGAARVAETGTMGESEAFAHLANYVWRMQGANRYITPELARRYMAVERARSRGISAVRPGGTAE